MNSLINATLATCSFELRRSFTFQRTAVSIVLALFPPVMLGLMIFGSMFAESRMSDVEAGVISENMASVARVLTVLMVALVTLLSLLLWATPNVNSELEGKSWSFIASRPGGRISVFLGKFLASFFVASTLSLIAVTLCVFISSRVLGVYRPTQLWLAMMGVFVLASAAYAAVFSLIGTLFLKRSMVFAAGYIIGSEIVVASIPGALINKFTLRFHLQELGIQWIGWFVPDSSEADFRQIFGPAWPSWIHVLILLGVTLSALAVGCWIIVNREYITSDES